MKRLGIFAFEIIVLLLLSPPASAQTSPLAVKYDAVKDWSSVSNPNGVWSYGYLASRGALFALDTAEGGNVPGTSAWWPSTVGTGPVVAHNDTDKTICGTTFCVPPNYLGLHPGPDGELSVLRWTTPFGGNFLLQVSFQGLDFAFPTSTNVYVVRDSTRVFLKAPITSYAIPLLFEPTALQLSKGETLDFMVDWGNDASYIGDSTGVEVKIYHYPPTR